MKTTKQEKLSKILEEEHLYNNETTNIAACHYGETDENFEYFKYGFWGRLLGTLTKILLKIFLPLIVFFIYHLKIEGKENLKKTKGKAVVGISNHSQYTDMFISKRVFYSRRYYITAAIFNNKSGISGNIMRCLGMIPITRSQSLSARRGLDNAISQILSNKKNALMFYPEKAMWKNYRKPRPFLKGAFYYAAKNNVPVLPMIVLYRPVNKIDNFFGRKNKLTVKILPPITASEELSFHDKVEYLQKKAQYLYNVEYEKFYGKKNDVLDALNPDEKSEQ